MENTNRIPRPWTATQDAKMKEMLTGGYSFAAIGNTINRSRCAVAGRAMRLGLRKDPIPAPTYTVPSPIATPNRRITMPVLRKIEEIKQSEIILNGVSIVDLESYHCRFIVGRGEDELARYCGADKKTGSSYCSEHHSIIYVRGNR